ncbi:MAG: TonB-dependent receptor [Bacteroidetes bacterium]|nr:TonB-dependent receptor [Bacteroidota bacterium]MDA0879798.1 TonB-dependent receptor [Bacteroidota bacterium]MDA1115786.1 TonB-dependent receptor [Bacteroidota bacterium]
MKTFFQFLFLVGFSISFAQTTVKGSVTDDSGQPLPGANVVVVGTSQGAVTDFEGTFSINLSTPPPFNLQVSSVGFETQTIAVTDVSQPLSVVMTEGNSLDEVVVSASRTPERVFESPVTIERFGIADIKNTASSDFYDGLENLKGVDINTNSLTFKSINTRGFATFANTRFMQLVDGMDNSAPALNFPLGNLLGMIETDVQSVEILPGASSALYGANAFNGILFMTSKSAFDHQGISSYIKRGITSQEAAGDNTYVDLGVRVAHAFSDKFAAKMNFGYLEGTDWVADNRTDKFFRGLTRADYDYDGVNTYGDEVATNIRAASGGLGIVPNVVVSRTGYAENELTDHNALSLKTDWGFYFRPFADDLELSYVGKFGTGNTLFQGLNRYAITNFSVQQHKLELKNDNFFLRGYVTSDDAGDSYDMVFTGININRAWKSDAEWFGDYINTFVGASLNGATQPQAHAAARAVAEAERFVPGSPEFIQAFNNSISNPDLTVGSKFQDTSKYYHADGNYNFKDKFSFAEVQVGGSYRLYSLNSSGTIYTDYDGSIDYSEFGLYTQMQKKMMDDRLKITASVRYDKSEYFDGFLSPRLGMNLTLGQQRNHNVRASVQTGFRNPTTQDLFIGLDAGRAILVGGSPANLDRYSRVYPVSASGQAIGAPSSVTQTGGAAYTNSFLASSVSAATAAGDLSLLQVGNSALVKPEEVTSLEFGYRGKIGKITADLSAYYSTYKNFISGEAVIAPLYGTVDANNDGTVDFDPLSLGALVNGDYKVYQTYTNSKVDISSYGASVGLSAKVLGNFDLSGNYTYAKQDFDQAKNPSFETNFNTPEHRAKLSFGNTDLFRNFGFNVAWKWSDEFFWEQTFGDGVVPSYHVLDAQVNLRMPEWKSSFKVGASNLLGDEYFTAFGTGYIGSQYYVSWTINNL